MGTSRIILDALEATGKAISELLRGELFVNLLRASCTNVEIVSRAVVL